MPRARTTLFLFLLPALASVFVAAPGGATAFGATLELRFAGFGPLSWSGSGSGASSVSGVAVPGGVLSGSRAVPGFSPPLTQIWASVEGNGAGSFLGTPLGGRMPVGGSFRAKAPAGGPLTVIYVPLFQTHSVASGAASIGLGFGGSDGFLFENPEPYPDAFLRWEHTLWTVGMKTLSGVMYTYGYHVPAGKAASMNESYTYSNGTAMYTGTDSRTPGGLGRLTLVSPTKVSTNLLGPSQVFVLLGTLTLEFVPEPGTLTLLAVGIAALAARGRRAARRAR